MGGRLIVLEGLDGSGKHTQAVRLEERLRDSGIPSKMVSFPDYEQPSSVLVREYLAGDYGTADEVPAYAAGSFYAVDRYASYHRLWKKDYLAGHTIVADRYVTSNLIYQMCKLPETEWEAYAAWVEDYEYGKLELPRPDTVFYLAMDLRVSEELIRQRYHGDESRRDIHESDTAYLRRCAACAEYAVERFGWTKVQCSEQGSPLPLEAIGQQLWKEILELNIGIK